MKCIKYSVMFIALFLFNAIFVYAAPSHSISVNRNQIEVGQSVTGTVTVRNAAAWNIRVNGTGNTNGCSTSSADATTNGKNATKTFKVTCSANSTGVIKISYSGDATSEDGATVALSGSKTITVVAARPKSSNNFLKSLSVDGGILSPEFDKNTLDYSVTFEPGTEKINIKAEREDGYASLTGDGEKDVTEGDNKFEVVVTSETGNARVYNINVVVKEFAPINVVVKDVQYTVARKLQDIEKPVGFTDATVKIGEEEVPAFYNETTKTYLVGLKDEEGKIYLFSYKDGKYERYYEFKFTQVTLNIIEMNKKLLPNNYKKFTVMLNDEQIDVYKQAKESNFALVYGIDVISGEKNLYQVDLKNNTVQIFNEEFTKNIEENNKKVLYVVAALGGVILIEFFAILISRGRRKRLIAKIKSEKVESVKTKAIKDAKKETIESKEEIKEKEEKEDYVSLEKTTEIKEVEVKKDKKKKSKK